MGKRTKIQVDKGAIRGDKSAVIREIYVDSGRVKRIRCRLFAADWESLNDQVHGALSAIASEDGRDPVTLVSK
jgi:hypothetical protein